MVDRRPASNTLAAGVPAQATFEYKVARGAAIVVGIGWLGVALGQWLTHQRYTEAAARYLANGNGEDAMTLLAIAGGRLSEVIISLVLAGVCIVTAVALMRRTWHSWDIATVVIGIAAVVSLVFLCAQRRVIFAAPFTLIPLWWLLYRPGVKVSCGVGTDEPGTAETAADAGADVIDEQAEREALTGLRQSLRVFEIERGMDTDVFVDRYANGLEEESLDNEEWFALSRMARRAEDRLRSVEGQRRTEE